MLKFYEDTHSYTSDDNRKWLSATGIIGNYKKPFDEVTMSRHCSNKIDSKWYGMLPEKIVEIWHKERDRSTTLGKWLHKQREDQEGQENRCPVVNEVKYALSQQLTNGVYPEFILYHPVYGISGQADKIIVKDGKFQVRDYKTSKKIERSSYYKMLAPLNHLDACELTSYSLQLSLYASIILFHNPMLRIDKLVIEHVKLKIAYIDDYGYPVHEMDDNGNYIIESTEEIECEYLEKEINIIYDNIKDTE